MSAYTNDLTAEGLIAYIANDYVELSHDKVKWLYHEHIRICREWLQANIPEDPNPPPAPVIDNDF